MPIHINHINNTISTGGSSDLSGEISINFNMTSSIILPRGDTSKRPSAAVDGMFRYNTSTNFLEIYSNGNWRKILSDNIKDLRGNSDEIILEGNSVGINSSNFLKISNSISNESPKIYADGSDTNIDIEIIPKNNGKLKIGEPSTDGFISSDPNKNLILIGGNDIQLIPSNSNSGYGKIKIFNYTSSISLLIDHEKISQYYFTSENSFKNNYIIRLHTLNNSTSNYEYKLINNSLNFMKSFIIGKGNNFNNIIVEKIELVIEVQNSVANILYNNSNTYQNIGNLNYSFYSSGMSVKLNVIGGTGDTFWTINTENTVVI